MFGQSKLTGIQIVLIMTVAGLIDLVQFGVSFIPVAGEIISVLLDVAGILIFAIWLMICGISPAKPEIFLAFLAGTIFEAIPVADMLPGWSGTMAFICLKNKIPAVEAITSIAEGDVGGAVGALKNQAAVMNANRAAAIRDPDLYDDEERAEERETPRLRPVVQDIRPARKDTAKTTQ
jgi:hypothetical protein